MKIEIKNINEFKLVAENDAEARILENASHLCWRKKGYFVLRYYEEGEFNEIKEADLAFIKRIKKTKQKRQMEKIRCLCGKYKGKRYLRVVCDDCGIEVVPEGLEERMKVLHKMHQRILNLRFGLKDGVRRTLGEVGQMYGVTRERIRQTEVYAIEKLKANN